MSIAEDYISIFRDNGAGAEARRYPTHDWRDGLIVSDKGGPKALLANALHALREAEGWQGRLSFDEFSMTTMLVDSPPWTAGHFRPRPWTDADTVLATEWMQREGISVKVNDVEAAVEAVAHEHPRHRVRSYLNGLKWDGSPRVATWLSYYLGVESSEYVQAVGQCFLIGAVARVLKPGCKVDTMLILEGRQGAGKSTALSILGGEWFSDEIGDFGSKDAAMQARAAWILEIGELDAMSKAEATRTKAFLSRSTDKFRPPYGRRVIEAPRQCVFAGTTNGEAYLKDETGGRRFWPVRVVHTDLDALRQDRDQLWAEAVHLFRSGAHWWLDTDELVAAAAAEQAARYQGDPWDDAIGRFVEARSTITIPEILRDCLLMEKQRWTRAEDMRVARILKIHGFERRQVWNGGKPFWRYERNP